MKKLRKTQYSNQLNALPPAKKIDRDLGHLYRALKYSKHKDLLNTHQFIAAAQAGNSGDYEFLYLIENTKKIQPSELREAAENLLTSHFKGIEIYTLHSPKGNISIAQHKGLLLAGKYSFLIEYAITQVNDFGSNLTHEKAFRKAEQSALKQGDLTLYINYSDWSLLSATFLDETRNKETRNLQKFASWTSVDMNFEPEQLTLKGYTHPHPDNLLLQALSNEKQPESTKIARILPDHTAIMTCIGVQNFTSFYKKITRGEDANFRKYFLPWLGEEIAYVITEPHGNSIESEQFALMQVRDEKQAEELLAKYAKKWRKSAPEMYMNFQILKLPEANLLRPIFGEALNPIQYPHYTLIDDYALFANSRSALKLWIDKYTIGKTLAKEPHYLKFANGLTETSGLYLYFNTPRMQQLLKNYFNDEADKTLDSQYVNYGKFSPAGIQLLGFNKAFFTNGLIPYQEQELAPTSIVWKADLDAGAIIPPKVVKNQTSGELEIIVQDAMFQLYLIGKDGNIRWKRQLDSPILSEIHEIDIHADDRSQLMFNTADMMYLIRHDGKDVERKGYPRRLRNVTNGMAIFDYYGNKDYRLFIGDVAGNIFGYEKDGQPLTGWSPKEDIGQLELPVQHFLAEKKDYHIALNKRGDLHLLDRRGEHHVAPVNLEGSFLSGFDYDVSKKPYRITVVDETGIARIANLTGKFFRMRFKVGDNTSVKFAYDDVVEDERKDYVLLSGNSIAVYKHSDLVFEQQLPDVQEDIFTIKMPGKSKKNIGTLSATKRQIYLLDEQGQPYPNFPLAGTTRFEVSDLFGEGKDVLTVADGAVIYAYRL